MNILRIFGIGSRPILAKGYSVQGVVTNVQQSVLHTIKKPIRVYLHEGNTIFSHYITFDYCVNGQQYTGKLFIDLRYRCPQKSEKIEIFYDPRKPQNYACYAFGPGVRM